MSGSMHAVTRMTLIMPQAKDPHAIRMDLVKDGIRKALPFHSSQSLGA